MSKDELPPFYDDLDAMWRHALKLITRGVKDRRSPMHLLTVATIGLDGSPQVRSVVNRGYDPETRDLRFHTDARSPKLREIKADPRVAVQLYDAKAKIQLRLDTHATAHETGSLRNKAWEATRPFSRECYRVEVAPGAAVAGPQDIAFASDDDPDEGFDNFVPVTLRIHAMECLYLAHQGHRRSRVSWDDTGNVTATWLVP
ncbi:MAG: pyridoxamine 5'-phosphate oxidase family protein [Pseudomonadota bacterium]